MYTIIDIAFAAMILMIGAILIVYLLIGGTTTNTTIVTGIRDCIYAQIENNMIPFLLKEGKYSYVEKIVQSCGASNIVIYKITQGSSMNLVYPTGIEKKYVENVISKCSRIITIFIPIKENMYELLICTR
ncbi:MAG: hypothetical protein GXO23_02585 [Crenarchaeota archaeon]|nr:hypothetical protein [Thermoproteota archaeon]